MLASENMLFLISLWLPLWLALAAAGYCFVFFEWRSASELCSPWPSLSSLERLVIAGDEEEPLWLMGLGRLLFT